MSSVHMQVQCSSSLNFLAALKCAEKVLSECEVNQVPTHFTLQSESLFQSSLQSGSHPQVL